MRTTCSEQTNKDTCSEQTKKDTCNEYNNKDTCSTPSLYSLTCICIFIPVDLVWASLHKLGASMHLKQMAYIPFYL